MKEKREQSSVRQCLIYPASPSISTLSCLNPERSLTLLNWILNCRGSLVCSVFIFIGAVISAAGTNGDSFKLVLAGRIVLGLGSTVIETCTSKVCLLYAP